MASAAVPPAPLADGTSLPPGLDSPAGTLPPGSTVPPPMDQAGLPPGMSGGSDSTVPPIANNSNVSASHASELGLPSVPSSVVKSGYLQDVPTLWKSPSARSFNRLRLDGWFLWTGLLKTNRFKTCQGLEGPQGNACLPWLNISWGKFDACFDPLLFDGLVASFFCCRRMLGVLPQPFIFFEWIFKLLVCVSSRHLEFFSPAPLFSTESLGLGRSYRFFNGPIDGLWAIKRRQGSGRGWILRFFSFDFNLANDNGFTFDEPFFDFFHGQNPSLGKYFLFKTRISDCDREDGHRCSRKNVHQGFW
jgi:hypothetical protein